MNNISFKKSDRVIMHIDGDAFFASCEEASNPKLINKCIVIGQERGIASALSYTAKSRGVVRGMPISQVKKICPEAIIMPGNYDLYRTYAMRMYEIVRRFTPYVEEYSIDECFADITGMDKVHHMSYKDIGRTIKQALEDELGITFSVGIAPNKVLAKIGSTWDKPSGFTRINHENTLTFLKGKKVGDIWGIGSQTKKYLESRGIKTAYQFTQQSLDYVHMNFKKPHIDIYYELHGAYRISIEEDIKSSHYSLSATRTFTPSSHDREYVFSQLSRNIERACRKLRKEKQYVHEIEFFLKSDAYVFSVKSLHLPHVMSFPTEILLLIRDYFDELFDPTISYRATGITLKKLRPQSMQPDLFNTHLTQGAYEKVAESVDLINKRFGVGSIFCASSYHAHQVEYAQRKNMNESQRSQRLLKGESAYQRLYIPWLGEV